MICKFCGNEIDDNAFFCVLCGEIVDNSDDGKKQKVDLKKKGDEDIFPLHDHLGGDSDETVSVFDMTDEYEDDDDAETYQPSLMEEPEIIKAQTSFHWSEEEDFSEPQIVREDASRPESDATPQPVAPQPVAPQQKPSPQPVAPQPAAPQPAAPQPAAPQPAAPQPAAPQSVAPQPAAPQPAAPQPVTPQRTPPPQPAVQKNTKKPKPDLNAMRGSVIAGFSGIHSDRQDFFGRVVGTRKSFPLFQYSLIISPDKDVFNTYRLKFRELAIKYANKFIREYGLLIVSYESFIQFFPAVYFSNMEYLIHAALDCLNAENVRTQTFDSFYRQHKSNYHAALDFYNSVNAKGMSFPAQRVNLFRSLVPSALFHNVYLDYWQVFLTLISHLRANGKNIWWGTNAMASRANALLNNLSDPRFPREYANSLVFQILGLYPYSKPLFYRMTRIYGDTQDIAAIRQYFGYTDMSNPRIL